MMDPYLKSRRLDARCGLLTILINWYEDQYKVGVSYVRIGALYDQLKPFVESLVQNQPTAATNGRQSQGKPDYTFWRFLGEKPEIAILLGFITGIIFMMIVQITGGAVS